MAEFRVKAQVDNLHKVLDFIDGEYSKLSDDMGNKFALDISVEEIFVNIANYAYEGAEGDALIIFEAKNDGKTAVVHLVDSGIPYDPLAKEDPDITLSAEDRQIGGLGVFMVKQSMDRVAYRRENEKNIFTMEKDLI